MKGSYALKGKFPFRGFAIIAVEHNNVCFQCEPRAERAIPAQSWNYKARTVDVELSWLTVPLYIHSSFHVPVKIEMDRLRPYLGRL